MGPVFRHFTNPQEYPDAGRCDENGVAEEAAWARVNTEANPHGPSAAPDRVFADSLGNRPRKCTI